MPGCKGKGPVVVLLSFHPVVSAVLVDVDTDDILVFQFLTESYRDGDLAAAKATDGLSPSTTFSSRYICPSFSVRSAEMVMFSPVTLAAMASAAF